MTTRCMSGRFVSRLVLVALTVALCRDADGHPWHRHAEPAGAERKAAERETPAQANAARVEPDETEAGQAVPVNVFRLTADRPARGAATAPSIIDAFTPFAERGEIAIRQDDRWLYVESHGVPDHPLMMGIRTWQQQVPLPQPYVGDNSWQIPLEPVPAANPRSTRNAFLRGAIAVAVNGIPIFNPLNNRGEDSFAIGELDTFGGHCDRADDYHYHQPPVHLEQQVGKGRPIAYALDGYPIYGFTEPDGSRPRSLDVFNGHETPELGYHYHATTTYPYLNGGFYGEVIEKDGQVDPQPRAQPRRESLRQLPGARIVRFTSPAAYTKRLVYEVGGREGSVEYTLRDNGSVLFTYTDPNGVKTSEEVRERRGGGGRQAGGGQRGGGERGRGQKKNGPVQQQQLQQRGGRQRLEQSAAEDPPNVILVLIDDLGWRDVGFMGNTFVDTPNIDRLAREGIVFEQAYASAPNCAPTRACLMSGQIPPRHGVYTVVDPRQPVGAPWHKLLAADSNPEMAEDVVTIPEALAAAGYRSGFFGMWNLGRGRSGPRTPAGQGFDHVVFPQDLGFGKDAYFDDEGRQLSDRLTDAVIAFATEPSDRPFFAYYADHAVHAPFEPEADLLAKYEQKAAGLQDGRNDPAYAATIEAVDRNIGRIMQAVTSKEIAENTLVIFTSDNGGTASYTPPLAGGKGQLYEGGIRVPLAMWWPGTIQPGLTSAEPVASIDFFPTLLELAGLVPQSQLDGASLVPLLSGKRLGESRPLFWHFPCYIGKSTPSSAVRDGDYKLIEFFEDGGHVELYNLRQDPGESNNLASTEPAKASALATTLRTWRAATQAAIPSQPNPAYDPATERPRGRQPRAGRQNGKGGRKGGQRKQR